MFRFGFRSACPQTAFSQGAKSVFYMNQFMSRRHCARAHTPLVNGFINPTSVAGDCSIRNLLPMICSGACGAMSPVAMAQLAALCSGGNAATELASIFSEFGTFPIDAIVNMTHYSLLATFGRCVFRSNMSCIASLELLDMSH
jgi:hypothetical protein